MGAIGKANSDTVKTTPPVISPPPSPPSPPPTTNNNYYNYAAMAPANIDYGVEYSEPTEPVIPKPSPPVAEPVEKKAPTGLWGMDLGTTLSVGIAAAGLLYFIYQNQNKHVVTSKRIKK